MAWGIRPPYPQRLHTVGEMKSDVARLFMLFERQATNARSRIEEISQGRLTSQPKLGPVLGH